MKTIVQYAPDLIIVGAGITGCTIANIMANKGWKAIILEKRKEIGGNCTDSQVDNYYVHQYGPHIFHTSDDDIWNYVSQFAKFNNFVNTPLVVPQGMEDKMFNLPFNMNLFSRFYNEYEPSKIQEIIKKDIEESCEKYGIDRNNQKNLEEQAISLVGEKIYKAFIEKYTEKQWGKKCTELSPDVIKRLPLRYTYNNNYFNDQYQGIPINGFTNMMSRMLNHENIYVRLNTNFKDMEYEIMDYVNDKDIPIVYTGPIDELFDYKYGHLEWRTVSFDHHLVNTPNYQGNAVVNNATDQKPYTRIIEHKHFNCLNQDDVYKYIRTIISYEIPETWKPGMEPYYPINTEENNKLLHKYEEECDAWPNLYLIGRLAEYKYKDMAPSIDDAIKLCWELIYDFKK